MIGDNLKRLRTERKLTQSDLGKKVGIKQSTISAIENGTNKPAADTIELLSNALGCSIDELFGRKQSDPIELTSGEEQILLIYRQLNLEGQELLINQAESILSMTSLRKEESIACAK